MGSVISIINTVLTQVRITNIHNELSSSSATVDVHKTIIYGLSNDMKQLRDTQVRIDLATTTITDMLHDTQEKLSDLQGQV